jgi:hypothetical protein
MSKVEKFWVDATADDVARVMAGETAEARFRDDEAESWTSVRALRGWSDGKWVSVLCWNHCQVYREPSWWTDKPDPGPGYRLLGRFPDEPKLGTDEAWDKEIEEWRVTSIDDGIQVEEVWYRRRIEVEPEPQHYVLRVGDSVETPSGHLINVVSPGVEQIEYKLKAGFTAKLPNGQTITATEKGFEVTQ